MPPTTFYKNLKNSADINRVWAVPRLQHAFCALVQIDVKQVIHGRNVEFQLTLCSNIAIQCIYIHMCNDQWSLDVQSKQG